jgi:hypothetical protein
MAVVDDLRRLSQLDSMFLGWSHQSSQSQTGGAPILAWFKGRVQQANDGGWLFRSISSDGTLVGFQFGQITPSWSSSEAPATGISVTIPIMLSQAAFPTLISLIFLQQQLPLELTN